MILSALVAHINELSGENEPISRVASYINDAIAKINIRLKANFPYTDITNDVELPFPEEYQRAVVVPFAVGRIKQADSSQFEYTDAYSEFVDALGDMVAYYPVPDNYKKPDSAITSDIYTTPPNPWGYGW